MTVNQNLKNIFSLFTVEFLSRVMGFIAITYLARVLSKPSFGIINLGLAVLSYGTIISNSGLSQLGTRKIISTKSYVELLTGEIVFTRLFASLIIFFCVLVVILFFIPSSTTAYTILLYSIALFPAAFLLEWFFYGHQKINIISIGRVIGMIAYVLIVVSIVRKPDDVELTAIAWVAGGIMNALYLCIVFKKLGHKIKIRFSIMKYILLLKESFHLSIASIIAQVVVMFPVLYLGIVSTASDVGTFSAAQKMIILFLAVDRIFSSLFFPKITKCFNETPHKLRYVFIKTLKLITLFSFSCSLIVFVCSELIVTTVFGDKFSDALNTFKVLIGYFALTLINSIFSFTLIGMNKERVYSNALLSGMLVFFVSAIVLTQIVGIAGAAAGMVLFELTSFIVMAAHLGKKMELQSFRIVVPAFFVTGVFFALFTFFTIPFYGQLLLALFAGVPALIWLSGFAAEELQFIKKVFG